jgi:sugar phosphate isomerase/epimerase
MLNDANVTRRKFLANSALSVASIGFSSFSPLSLLKNNIPDIGLCGSWQNNLLAKQAGCTYIEDGVTNMLMPLKPDGDFNRHIEIITAAKPLEIRACNVFIPSDMPLVGDFVNHESILKYAATAFQRAKKLGVKIIVLGSGRARKIPDGFERTKAKEQFISFCSLLGPLAANHNIAVAIEQLNRSETNFINTLQEAAEIVEAVHHPNIKMMCDIYHALRENDPASEIIKYKEHLIHCHIAEKETRTPPGTKGDDFTSYFHALKKIRYMGAISLECNWKNIEGEIGLAVRVVKEQFSIA